jgi:hypothetical protein
MPWGFYVFTPLYARGLSGHFRQAKPHGAWGVAAKVRGQPTAAINHLLEVRKVRIIGAGDQVVQILDDGAPPTTEQAA